MTTTPVLPAEHVAAIDVRRPIPGRVLLAFAALVAVTGVVLWLALGGETPRVTFDGEVATYTGATTFDEGAVTFTFDSTGYPGRVIFIVGELEDDDLTMADLRDYAAENIASRTPPFISTFQSVNATDEVVESDMDLTAGRWSVWALDVEPNEPHPAAIFEVTAAN